MAEYFYRIHGIKTISFRLGMFVPKIILALENKTIGFDAFNIMSDVPFTQVDETELVLNPRKVIVKYYPGANEVFTKKGINVEEIMSIWGNTYWSIHRAKERLGFFQNTILKGL